MVVFFAFRLFGKFPTQCVLYVQIEKNNLFILRNYKY